MGNKSNAQKHFDYLHKIGESVTAALMLCEELSHANEVLRDGRFRAATSAKRSIQSTLAES